MRRLGDEELNAIDEQCDGLGFVVLNPAAQRDVRSMLAEIRERRAADLTAFEEVVLQSHLSRIADDPLIDRAVVRLIDRLLGGRPAP